MEHRIKKEESVPKTVAWLSAVAVLLLVLAYGFTMLGGGWTLWIESSQVTLSMQVEVLGDSFLELRLNGGSHNTKEKMDSQKDCLDVWRSVFALCHSLWIAERRR